MSLIACGSIHQGHEQFSDDSGGRLEIFMCLSALLSNRSPRADAQSKAFSGIPAPSECSLVSSCTGSQSSDSKEDLIYESGKTRENPSDRENVSEDFLEARNDSFVNSRHNSLDSNQLSLTPAYAEMEDQVSQLCQAVERMQASVNSQNRSGGVKASVTFPIFRGDESEDAHKFVRNYKRAGRLNGWDSDSLALGLPLYLKAYASAWFKTLPRADEVSFEELSEKLVTHFASGATEWRVRQALGQRRQLEKESVADYAYSLRTHCARIDLPNSEWTVLSRDSFPRFAKLGVPDSESGTTVNGSRLTTIGKTLMEFVIDSRIFTFEVCVIEDLSFDDILGRDFLQRFCFKVDFGNGLVSFPSEPSPFPFEGVRVDDDNDLIDKAFISSVHASRTFVIPPQSEILISGELEDSSIKYGIDGMIVPKPDLSHIYSIFGASELVGVAEDGTIPIRYVIDLNKCYITEEVDHDQARQGDMPSALEDLDKAIQQRKDRGVVASQAYTQRALIHRLNCNEDKALEDFTKAANLSNAFARSMVVQMNPYAAMCNRMLADAINQLRGEPQ
ncbi:Tetratricopeptide repeat protein 36 [Stylophora pistillata]|uniref:Tetratricopeptide repeat protein 36 n=1 Tax=Stylophora pistillata TaxID=50429 RepID=A0A2B4RS63_STYPI|nr:Tetratricopeptide repeat protein 36 [Stylophora pistillata]